MVKLNGLNSFQVDALQELGNIGVGNAVTSMAQMLEHRVDIGVTKILILPLNQIYEHVGDDPEKWVSCISVKYSGDASYYFMLILERQSSLDLIDLLMGQKTGTTRDLDEISMSVLKELGNILSGSFATALSSLTGLNFVGNVPMIACDMFSAIMNAMVIYSGQLDDKILLFKTEFFSGYEKTLGKIMIIPEPGFLNKILSPLGIENI